MLPALLPRFLLPVARYSLLPFLAWWFVFWGAIWLTRLLTRHLLAHALHHPYIQVVSLLPHASSNPQLICPDELANQSLFRHSNAELPLYLV